MTLSSRSIGPDHANTMLQVLDCEDVSEGVREDINKIDAPASNTSDPTIL